MKNEFDELRRKKRKRILPNLTAFKKGGRGGGRGGGGRGGRGIYDGKIGRGRRTTPLQQATKPKRSDFLSSISKFLGNLRLSGP